MCGKAKMSLRGEDEFDSSILGFAFRQNDAGTSVAASHSQMLCSEGVAHYVSDWVLAFAEYEDSVSTSQSHFYTW